jgi:acyl phosphate:glycerol-3-phosphate acyltransferase
VPAARPDRNPAPAEPAPADGARRPLPAPAVLGAAFLAGSIPFSNIAARLLRRVDLRDVGSGTVSGTSLFAVAGFVPLAVAGVLEVAKGAVGPVLAGRDRPALAAAAGGLAVVGHNWSPWLGGAGGRGLSPAIGALLPRHPAGSALILAGMAGGRLAGETAVGCAVADAALVPVLSATGGRPGRQAAIGVLVPMLAKRLAGNRWPERPGWAVWVWRLLYDRDSRAKTGV